MPARPTGASWGPYVSERQWGTVREDYSATGEAWAPRIKPAGPAWWPSSFNRVFLRAPAVPAKPPRPRRLNPYVKGPDRNGSAAGFAVREARSCFPKRRHAAAIQIAPGRKSAKQNLAGLESAP